MLSNARIVAVVPAWDEAPRIQRVLRAMPPCVDNIVVVDDASTDGTAALARAVRDERVEVLTHVFNRGVGAAIVTGYKRAMELVDGPRDALVVMAGDGQMDPVDLPSIVGPVAKGEADYVKGNRFVWPGVERTMPVTRRAGGSVFSWLTSRAIGRHVTDSQCGYTALARAACSRLDLDALWPRYGYPNDLLAQLAARGLTIAEVPVRPIYGGIPSKLRPHHVGAIAWIVARAWIKRLAAHRLEESALEAIAERVADDGRRVPADVAAVAGNLSDEGRRDESVLRARRQEDRVDLRAEVGVGVGDLELVLEIGRSAQPSHDDARSFSPAVLDEEAVERFDAHVRQVGAHALHELEALVDREERRARGVHADADDDMAEERARALDEVEVA